MKNYLRNSILLLIFSAVAFTAGYIYCSKKIQRTEINIGHRWRNYTEFIWPYSHPKY